MTNTDTHYNWIIETYNPRATSNNDSYHGRYQYTIYNTKEGALSRQQWLEYELGWPTSMEQIGK